MSAHAPRDEQAPSRANSVRPWPCTKCQAQAHQPCRSLTTGRVTDTHTVRLTRPAGFSTEDTPR